ncbi:MAG: hypothetical protein QNJ97_27630 [Myxococcota bacterium]|nr:hypothetical protein [Myxococcota bacterium]
MKREIYRYHFNEDVPFLEIFESFILTMIAVNSLYGSASVRLNAIYNLEEQKRRCDVDGSTEIGQTIARIFTGFVSRQFGYKAFKLERKQVVVSAK